MVYTVTDKDGNITLFASEELARKSVEFSCHKLGSVTWTWDGPDALGTDPKGNVVRVSGVHVYERVTHL